mmetsp:Transcript_26339/g.77317  ORF Transcript_26339/g.77317 Transcript_26339/m.77317 type:complete len:2722 (+) Transcript_26339:41-8206(+)
MRADVAFALCALASVATGDSDEWVDPDTPSSKRTKVVDGVLYELVFSDEFSVAGRTFADGHDPVWTALNGFPNTNDQYNAYNDSLAYTEGGKLILETTVNDYVDAENPSNTRTYQTAMIQSWNKFCFTEGYVEISAKMPGRSDVGGLWPAFWLFGNLGRATFQRTTDNIWPFTFDQCPADSMKEANQFGTQKLDGCGDGPARGAPEIDIIETMPGDFVFDYQARIDSGECASVDPEVLERIRTRQPFVSTSVQAAPGQHRNALERPKLGCLPENFTAPDGSVRLQYYEELYPSPHAYGAVYGTEYDVALNYWFYGDDYEPSGKRLHTDALSANTMLNATHFTEQHRYQCEWKAGDDGFVRYTLDDVFQYNVPASMLTARRPMTFQGDDAEYTGTLLPRKLPDEALYMILNVDLAPRWGWPTCPDECDCCTDCRLSRCTTCLQRDEFGNEFNARQWLAKLCAQMPVTYEIDYIRIYQPPSSSAASIGCDPKGLETSAWIEKHRDWYTPAGADEPLKFVAAGGANCTRDAQCGFGSCKAGPGAEPGSQRQCACESGYTGPRCLARAVGWSRVCADLTATGLEDAAQTPECLALAADGYDDLAELIDRQCDVAATDGDPAAVAACDDVRLGGRFRGCSMRQRANHVLRAWSVDAKQSSECCNLLARTGKCSPRQPMPRPVVLALMACILALLTAPLLRLWRASERTRLVQAIKTQMTSTRMPAWYWQLRASLFEFREMLLSLVGRGQPDVLPPTSPRPPGTPRGPQSPGKRGFPPNQPGGKRNVVSGQYGGKFAPVAPHGDPGVPPPGDKPRRRRVCGGLCARAEPVVEELPPEEELLKGTAPRERVSEDSIAQLAYIFDDLEATFGFQPDSVRTQHQHLQQLWDHQTSGCGDEVTAAAQLHNTMFESFERWLDMSAGLHSYDRGSKFVFVQYRMPSFETRLKEMALYLLLWGEAGNLRFCPEIMCFFFECARRHVRAKPADGTDAAVRPYMEAYVQPLYRYMFSAGYTGLNDYGELVPRPKVLGEVRINYDDMNEMAWTPERVLAIVTDDGVPVLDHAAHERWAALGCVDWAASLDGCKRHREVHGWACVFSSYARLWILHVATYFLLMVIAHFLYAATEWLRPRASPYLFSGLLLPGLVQVGADLCRVRLKPGVTVIGTLFLNGDRSLPVLLHVGLFGVVAAYPGNETLIVVYCIYSALVVAKAVVVPRTFRRRPTEFDAFIFAPKNTIAPLFLFWVLVLCAKCAVELVVLFRTLVEASERLEQLQPLVVFVELEVYSELLATRQLTARVLQQGIMWICAFLVHLAATFHWYVLGVCIVGTARGVHIHYWSKPRNAPWAERVKLRKLSDLPSAAVSQIFGLDADVRDPLIKSMTSPLHPVLEQYFARVWNAIVKSMHEIDVVSKRELAGLLYTDVVDEEGTLGVRPPAQAPGRPAIFQTGSVRQALPASKEFRRRLDFFEQSLIAKMPVPAPVEAIPSFSVLIPHFAEPIIVSEDDILTTISRAGLAPGAGAGSREEPAPLIALLMEYFPAELKCFHSRVGNAKWRVIWEAVADKLHARGELRAAELARRESAHRQTLESLDESAVDSPRDAGGFSSAMKLSEAVRLVREHTVLVPLRKWASLHLQTLYRTVKGMMYYEQAMDVLLSIQRPDLSPEERRNIVVTKFQCVVSMQRYADFDQEDVAATELMLAEFPSLNIAYIETMRDDAAPSGFRFFSCLIDGSCGLARDGRRVPKARVELPGHPILGDGKGDNQNHALPFVRGRLLQTIDANQEGYLEEAFKVCNALAEFSADPTMTRERISIVGFREHIYSSLGTVANFAASSEFVFGTLLQRTMDRPLLSRQHYGHPDIMEKLTMMAQGGLSKATKGLNLSEDVFAGMDLILRGGNIVHREYLQVGKGREMSFIAHNKFVSKLARGCAEVTLSRQSYRLGTRLNFLRMLSTYFGHVGHYLTPVFMEATIWYLAFMLLYFVLCDAQFEVLVPEDGVPDTYSSIASDLVDSQFGPLAVLFVSANALPLLFETALNSGIPRAIARTAKQLATLSLVFFSFQAQLTGYQFRTEISAGGAQYMATGRGIVTTRQPFDVLYRMFGPAVILPGAELALILGAALLATTSRMPQAGYWVGMGFAILSWILAPSIFNPHMFDPKSILVHDLLGWYQWIKATGPGGWLDMHVTNMRAWSDRPWAFFVFPGRRFIASFMLLCLLNDVKQRPLRYDVVESILLAVPVVPVVLALGLGPCLGRVAPAFARTAPFRGAADGWPRPSPAAVVILASLTLAWHCVELWIHARHGTFVGALMGATEPLNLSQVVVVGAAKYFCLHCGVSLCTWLLPARVVSPTDWAKWRWWQRLGHDAVRLLALAYFLIVDTLAMVLVLVPMLAISCIPGVRIAHMVLLLHVRPSKELVERAKALTTPQRKRRRSFSEYADASYASAQGAWARRPSMHVSQMLGRSRRRSSDVEPAPVESETDGGLGQERGGAPTDLSLTRSTILEAPAAEDLGAAPSHAVPVAVTPPVRAPGSAQHGDADGGAPLGAPAAALKDAFTAPGPYDSPGSPSSAQRAPLVPSTVPVPLVAPGRRHNGSNAVLPGEDAHDGTLSQPAADGDGMAAAAEVAAGTAPHRHGAFVAPTTVPVPTRKPGLGADGNDSLPPDAGSVASPDPGRAMAQEPAGASAAHVSGSQQDGARVGAPLHHPRPPPWTVVADIGGAASAPAAASGSTGANGSG